MNSMFNGCESLSSIDVSHFDTRNVTMMKYMFKGCSSLVSISLPNFDTRKVTTMRSMFQSCSNLRTIDITSFDTHQVTGMTEMFMDCAKLNTIYVGYGWNVDAVTSSDDMFTYSNKLYGGNGSHHVTVKDIKEDKTYAVIDKPGQRGYMTKGSEPLAIWCEGSKTFYFDYSHVPAEGGTYNGQTVTKMWRGGKVRLPGSFRAPEWVDVVAATCTGVVFTEAFKNVEPNSNYYWFKGFSQLETITGLEYLNTSQSENMERMFDGCEKLTSLNLSNFNTSKVRSMKFMFQNCAQLTTLDLSNFDVAHVTDMNGIFQGCSQLATLNISGLNPYNTTYMGYMFKDCVALTSLDLTSFETNSAKEMQYMFSGCTGLEKINISYGWYTGHVANSEGMFTGCTSLVGGNGTEYDASHTDKTYARGDEEESPGYLTYVPVEFTEERAMAVWCEDNTTLYFDYGFVPHVGDSYSGRTVTAVWSGAWVSETNNTGNQAAWVGTARETCTRVVFTEEFKDHVTPYSLKGWFYNFNQLTTFEGWENLNTSKVTDMKQLFASCSSLTCLDLSNWDISNLRYVSYMFRGCSNLKAIIVGDNWNTDGIYSSADMLGGCSSLMGEGGARIVSGTTVDKTNAHTNTNGLLTKKTVEVATNDGGDGYFYSTYYKSNVSRKVDDGTEVYIGTLSDDQKELNLTKVSDGIIQAGQGVILRRSEPGNATLTSLIYGSEDDYTGNQLKGSEWDTSMISFQNSGKTAYVLSKENGVVGFYRYTGEKLAAHKAYLAFDSSMAAPGFFFNFGDGGETTPVSGKIIADGDEDSADWYTLDGRKLQGKPAKKGLYIRNGKTVVIK